MNGRLPQVSWVVAPFKYCEHPDASPTDGAYYINLVLKALTVDPEVWSRTAFILNYDENDGLFDHIIPPMPPVTQKTNAQGLVSPDLLEALQDELIDMDKYPQQRRPLVPGSDPGGLQPIGLGPRVPLLIISPWTVGGWVCSQTFDHTSVLQFLEARFGVHEPNINQWRRSICGDLTSAFDFTGTAQTVATRVPVPQLLPHSISRIVSPRLNRCQSRSQAHVPPARYLMRSIPAAAWIPRVARYGLILKMLARPEQPSMPATIFFRRSRPAGTPSLPVRPSPTAGFSPMQSPTESLARRPEPILTMTSRSMAQTASIVISAASSQPLDSPVLKHRSL